MTNTIYEALSLLSVGMITVFLILFLVIILGNLLIRFVNRFLYVKSKEPDALAPPEVQAYPAQSYHAKTAAIVAAVSIVTHGKGRIATIQKASQKV